MDDLVLSSIATRQDDIISIDRLIEWFDISEEDVGNLQSLTEIADDVADDTIDAFYEHILKFEEAAAKFADGATLERVKAGQKRYFRELVHCELGENYLEERRRIGQIHERAGIGPSLYIGAFGFYLQRLARSLQDQNALDSEQALSRFLSLVKVAHLDMAQALETFVGAREATIERQQNEISDLPTPVLQLREGLLLIPVVGAVDGRRARRLTIELLDAIREKRARAVVLDITGVSAVDSAVANNLIQTMAAARLMGAYPVLTGVKPDVAQALVKIGVNESSLNTSGELQSGIRAAESRIGA